MTNLQALRNAQTDEARTEALGHCIAQSRIPWAALAAEGVDLDGLADEAAQAGDEALCQRYQRWLSGR